MFANRYDTHNQASSFSIHTRVRKTEHLFPTTNTRGLNIGRISFDELVSSMCKKFCITRQISIRKYPVQINGSNRFFFCRYFSVPRWPTII